MITSEPALPAALSQAWGRWGGRAWQCSYLTLSFTSFPAMLPPFSPHAGAFTAVSESLRSKNLFQFDETQMKEIGLLARSCWLGLPTPQSLLTTGPEQDRCSVCVLPAFPVFIFLPGIPDYCIVGLIVGKFLTRRLNTPTLNTLTFSPHWRSHPSVKLK